MGQKRRRKPIGRQSRDRVQKRIAPQTKTGLLPSQAVSDETLQKYFHIFAIVILLGFGSYISITFYGHQVVPNSDFPAFGQTARELLSFEKPSSFKRTPGLGMLHVLFGYLMPGAHPELTAGWVLNAIFYTLIAVLLYLVGREILGPSAIWYAIIAALNPWTIAWMCHPLVETPLIFFVLLTFYLIVKKSRWSYAAAMMASMIRFEGSAMIMIAFAGDIIYSKTWRPILWASLAAIPLFLATLLQIIPTLANVIKIPLPEFSTLYNLKRFAIVFPFFVIVVICLILFSKRTSGNQFPETKNGDLDSSPNSSPPSRSGLGTGRGFVTSIIRGCSTWRWAYLPAGIACFFSLLAGLILITAVFAWDVYKSALGRKILPKLLLVLLASVPMVFWLYGTKQAQIAKPGSTNDYSKGYGRKIVIDQFSDYTWQLGISSYFVERVEKIPVANRPGVIRTIYHRLREPSQILLCISLILAVSYAIYKKQYNALFLIFFLFAYFLAHATRNGTRPRYAVPIAWLVLLVGCYGLRCGWLILNGNNQISKRFLAVTLSGLLLVTGWIGFRHIGSPLWLFLLLGICLALGIWKFYSPHAIIPKPIVIGLSLILLTVSLLWLFRLFPHLSKIAIYHQYRLTYYIPYVGMVAVLAVLVIRSITSRAKTIFPDLAVSALVCLMITSNQFLLAPLVKTGKKDIEFSKLANWYVENVTTDEKLVTTMPHVVEIFAPKLKDNLIRTGYVIGRSPSEFVQNCRLRDVDFVAWDSRIGIAITNSYYHSWGIDNMREWQLRREGYGPFSFVHKIGPDQYYTRRFINVFRLDLRQDPEEEAPEFSLLSNWYQKNSLPNENILSTRPHILDKLVPKNRNHFWHLGGIYGEIPSRSLYGEIPSRFLEACYRNRIRYIAWDSRLGLNPKDPYYKKWRMYRFAKLGQPKSTGPFEFICQLGQPSAPHINLFRLDLPPAVDSKIPPEFLSLGQWYSQITQERENPKKYKPPQILLTSIPEHINKICNNHRNYIWHTGSIRGDSEAEFRQRCLSNNVIYIAWDSFNGNNSESKHYQKWRLDRIKQLSEPRSIGFYKFVKRFQGKDGHYINLFRLERSASNKKK